MNNAIGNMAGVRDEMGTRLNYGLSVLANAPTAHPAAQTPPHAPGERMAVSLIRVLLVEDSMADARLVSIGLRESPDQRFIITHAASLKDACAALAQSAFDVVLLDITLPDSAGLPTLTRLRDHAPEVPVVVMTGNNDPSFAARALEAGAQDYLVKGDDSGAVVVRAIRYAITRMANQIEREALIHRLESEQRALQRELDAARAMQFDLLPRPDAVNQRLASLGLSVEAYFEPSSGIGGDLWGILDCTENRVAFFAFDFSGHGISAALNVFRLHTLMGEHGRCPDDPAATLGVLNQALKGLLTTGQYATIFLGIIDMARDELVWSAAGHPGPALICPGQPITLLDTRGTPLGAMASAVYQNRKIAFPRGSSLFMYSDALTEAVNARDEMLGDEGLMALLDETMAAEHGDLRLGGLLDRFFGRVRTPVEDDLTAIHIMRH